MRTIKTRVLSWPTKKRQNSRLWSISTFYWVEKLSFSRAAGVCPWCSWRRGHARSASFSSAETPGSWQPGGCCTQAHPLSSSRVLRPQPDRAPTTQRKHRQYRNAILELTINHLSVKNKLKNCSIVYCSTYLLHLEFDCGFDLIHLGSHVLVVGEQGGELAGLVQSRTEDTRDLLDQRLRGQEGVVLLG